MANANSVIVDPDIGWKADHRGYIHGGFDTPVFGQVKRQHNSRLTSRRNKIKKSMAYGIIPPEVRAKSDEFWATHDYRDKKES